MINFTTIYANYVEKLSTISYNLVNRTEILLSLHELYVNNLTDSTIIVIKSIQCKREILFAILYVISIYITSITISYTLDFVIMKIYNLFKYIKSVCYNTCESVDENIADSSVNGVNDYCTKNIDSTDLKNDLFIKINTNKSKDTRSVIKVRRSTRKKENKQE